VESITCVVTTVASLARARKMPITSLGTLRSFTVSVSFHSRLLLILSRSTTCQNTFCENCCVSYLGLDFHGLLRNPANWQCLVCRVRLSSLSLFLRLFSSRRLSRECAVAAPPRSALASITIALLTAAPSSAISSRVAAAARRVLCAPPRAASLPRP